MMFAHNFVLAVKVDGKILREENNLVTLPFGSEYSLLIKNLNSRRAMVRVDVDGVDAIDGGKLVIEPNDFMELERFIYQGNMQAGNRLKFIKRTAEVEATRGIGAEDGLVRAEFWIEKEKPEPVYQPLIRDKLWPKLPPREPSMSFSGGSRPGIPRSSRSGGIQGQSINSQGFRSFCDVGESTATMDSVSNETSCSTTSCSTTGITVPGSESHQQFRLVSSFPVEAQSHVIVLQLRGEVAGKVVAKPVTVAQKLKCEICGRKNKASAGKFCSGCGAALLLI